MIFESKAHVFGDNVNADHIIPARHLGKDTEIKELIPYLMENIKQDFYKIIKAGDFIVAGENFGCGSSREIAPLLIKNSGVRAVIAKSFGRNFYRNAINIALLLVECNWYEIDNRDILRLDLEKGHIENTSKGNFIEINTPSPTAMKILEEDGLINYYKKYKKWPV